MHYELTQKPAFKNGHCLVLGVFSDASLPDFAAKLDNELHGLITKLTHKTVDAGDTVWQMDVQDASLLIIQCGPQQSYTLESLKKRINEVSAALNKHRLTSATLCFPPVPNLKPNRQLEQMLVQMDNNQYQLLEFKKTNPKPYSLESVQFYLEGADDAALHKALAIAEGINLTRRLANLPANICTPTYLGEQAKALAGQYKNLSCTVLGPDEMRALGMNTLLAVAQGSDEPPRFIELTYHGGGQEAPIVLVGKGITFDAGGLSIKPANSMEEMKYDMCGAASVLGTIKACAQLQLPVNLIGLIPSAENLLGGSAVKPGDIVTSMSGQTVEIINTDAEGRLVLADALTYAERFNPSLVVDIATLTGAIIVALGTVASGFMTKDEALAELIEQAALASNDKVWRMPLHDDYQEAIDSPLADMLNSTFDRTASSITAACFLSRFTKKYRWAHLDIAGTSWVFGKNRNATGRPVPLLIELIRHAIHTR